MSLSSSEGLRLQNQQRKLVFFLGAGASFAAGAVAGVQHGGHVAIPTQVNFWPTFLRFCRRRANEDQISAFLFRYFLGYARSPARLTRTQRRACLQGIDVEEVFTFLSERIRAPGTPSQLRTACTSVWEALLVEMPSVFGRFRSNAVTRQVYRALLRNQIRSRDRVVSFNYDTVFEESLPARQRWHYDVIQAQSGSLRILKPHGSWNWENGAEITVSQEPSHAVVVAPTHLKFVNSSAETPSTAPESVGYLDQSAQIEQIWSSMEYEMRRAKALVFIGYSFPIGDLYFSSVLRSVLAVREHSPRVIIVNPDALAIQKRLSDRFALTQVARYFDLETFAGVKRREVLEAARITP